MVQNRFRKGSDGRLGVFGNVGERIFVEEEVPEFDIENFEEEQNGINVDDEHTGAAEIDAAGDGEQQRLEETLKVAERDTVRLHGHISQRMAQVYKRQRGEKGTRKREKRNQNCKRAKNSRTASDLELRNERIDKEKIERIGEEFEEAETVRRRECHREPVACRVDFWERLTLGQRISGQKEEEFDQEGLKRALIHGASTGLKAGSLI